MKSKDHMAIPPPTFFPETRPIGWWVAEPPFGISHWPQLKSISRKLNLGHQIDISYKHHGLHIHIYMCLCVNIHIHVPKYFHVYSHLDVYIDVYIDMYIEICMYTCIFKCQYIIIYIYIYVCILNLFVDLCFCFLFSCRLISIFEHVYICI